MGERIQQEDLFGKPQVVEPEQRTAEDGAARPDAPPSVPEVRRYPERGSPLNGSYDSSDSGPLTRDDALAAARVLLSRQGSSWRLDDRAARHYRRPPDAMGVYGPRREMPCWVIPLVPDHHRVGSGRAVVVWDDTGGAEAVTFGE